MKDRDDQLSYDLALNRVPGIGSKTKHALIRRFNSASTLFSAREDELLEAGVPAKAVRHFLGPDWIGVEKDLEWQAHTGNSVILYRDADYPALLKEIFDPPYLIYLKGDVKVLNSPQISMVGSRRPTATGKRIARDLARELVTCGYVITSGLALGIDSMSHQGALEGNGSTIAVLAHGLDRIYPDKNAALASAAQESGAIISEYPLGWPPQRQNFPVRNRIISGLSLGTVVVEAARRSGSLITARLAAEQGRDVFAVPGSILNPLSEGCHWLLKQGARLTESAADILEETGTLAMSGQDTGRNPADDEKSPLAMDKNHQLLLELIGFEPVKIDELVRTSGLTAAEVSSMLLNMELSGMLESQLDGTYIRIAR